MLLSLLGSSGCRVGVLQEPTLLANGPNLDRRSHLHFAARLERSGCHFFSLLCPAQQVPTGWPFLPSKGLPEELAGFAEVGPGLPVAL